MDKSEHQNSDTATENSNPECHYHPKGYIGTGIGPQTFEEYQETNASALSEFTDNPHSVKLRSD